MILPPFFPFSSPLCPWHIYNLYLYLHDFTRCTRAYSNAMTISFLHCISTASSRDCSLAFAGGDGVVLPC